MTDILSASAQYACASASRWIAISTDMRFHPLVGCGQPVKPNDPERGAWSRYEAWQDIICEAAWKQRQVINKGRIVLLERGQIMAARSWLAKRWNWSEKQVRLWVEKLENEAMIEISNPTIKNSDAAKSGQQKGQQKANLISVLTICNYDVYQTARELKSLIEGQQAGQQGASEGPAKGQRGARTYTRVTKGTKVTSRESLSSESLSPLSGDEPPGKPGDDLFGLGSVRVNGASVLATDPAGNLLFAVPFKTIDPVAATAGIDPATARNAVAVRFEQILAKGEIPENPISVAEGAIKELEPDDSKRRAPKGYDPDMAFNTHFWKFYPHKVAKAEALAEWKKLSYHDQGEAYKGLQKQLDLLRADYERVSETGQRCCLHPSRWLKRRRWEDERDLPPQQKTKADNEKEHCIAQMKAIKLAAERKRLALNNSLSDQ